jgi:hypothetical protein
MVTEFRQFTPRQDYVYLMLALLADHRAPVPEAALGDLVDYATERDIGLILSQALRLRGLLRRDRGDLERALARFTSMKAVPFIARATAELGLMSGDDAAVERGLGQLEALGDIDHAARIASERKAGARAG